MTGGPSLPMAGATTRLPLKRLKDAVACYCVNGVLVAKLQQDRNIVSVQQPARPTVLQHHASGAQESEDLI